MRKGNFVRPEACTKDRNRRATTKEESLAAAKDFAEDWFLEIQAIEELSLVGR